MTASDITNRAVNRLQSVLQSKHAVLPVDTLDKLCEAEDSVSLAGARAVIGKQFDHRADLMILDPRLGTLGLVHALKPQTTTADIRRLIEHAAFTRHLVLSRRLDEDDGHRRLPLTVELVLMMPPGEPSLHTRVGNALVAIRRRTTHMHGFGISLLHFGEEPWPAREEEAELRRAFCWLLTNTRKWFTQQASVHPADQQPRRWIQSLTLTGWRVPGIRRLKFDLPSDPTNQKHADIHIVHGGNGAGKSSIVEAIEFALLGSVERLRETVASAVEHRSMSALAAPSGAENGRQPASVTLTMVVEGSLVPQTHTASSRGEPPPTFLPKLRAGSFRLDQSAMDRLASSDDRARAAYFLSRFFPADHEAITALDDARSNAETAWRYLPEDLAMQLSGREDGPAGLPPVGSLLTSLAWLAGPVFECKTETEGAGLCLPVALNDLQVLARIEPSLAEPVKRLAAGRLSEEALEEALRALDRPLHNLMELNQLSNHAAGQIDIARKALSRKTFDEWAPVPRTDVDNPVEALNRWLHALAFADLARRQRELLEALTDARKNGWHPNESGKLIGLTASFSRQSTKPSLLIEQLLKQEEDWKQQVINYEQKLPTAPSAVNFGTGIAMAVPTLTETERAALDAVTDWLLRSGVTATAISETPSPELPLGETVAEALRMGERRRCGALTIGEPGWADVIREELDTLATSLSRLNKRSDGRQRGRSVPEQRLGLLRNLHAAVRKLSEAQRKAEQSFLNKILPELEGPDAEPPLLSCALDELLTLFTPARWGYATLGLRRQTGTNGQQSLSFSHAGEGDAQLRLNTAELNLLTVALFLLCAPGTGNPVRLLVFDDPLQNMDEQTVTVLARGIGKLATLLPGGWQLVFFFHGEDDLARFRNELPARIYPLPWLMPVGTGAGEHPDVEGDYPPAPCATTHTRQSPKFVLRRPR